MYLPLFFEFGRNIKRIFTGRYLWWHVLAIVLTIAIVTSGFDWFYLQEASKYLSKSFFLPALRLGWYVPVLLPILLYVLAKIYRNNWFSALAFAVGQAALWGIILSSFFKAFTGRIPPRGLHATVNALPAPDISHGFQFGFLRGGIFWGWPSSHTTIAFAMAVAFAVVAAQKTKWAYFSLLYAFYVGIAVSFTIHWFSEFVAGALIGTAIGLVVGKSFSVRLSTKTSHRLPESKSFERT